MFESLKKKVNDVKEAVNPVELLHALFLDPEFTDLIIRLNTEGEQTSQLIRGVDSKGKQLDEIGGEYTEYTRMIKREKGQITDRVTLKDTGYFYQSFKTYWDNNEILIEADTTKANEYIVEDLTTRWGKDIIGLSEQNLGVLRDYARNKIPLLVKAKLAA